MGKKNDGETDEVGKKKRNFYEHGSKPMFNSENEICARKWLCYPEFLEAIDKKPLAFVIMLSVRSFDESPLLIGADARETERKKVIKRSEEENKSKIGWEKIFINGYLNYI